MLLIYSESASSGGENQVQSQTFWSYNEICSEESSEMTFEHSGLKNGFIFTPVY